MSFLLKIVQGPNAGAEIALAEGVNLSFGRGDDCDIILSDSSVEERAFELEVSGERVVAIMSGGKSVKLEPYRVTMIGTSAIVIGPQEGTWKALVWPRPEKVEDAAGNDEQEPVATEEAPPAKRRSWGCLIIVLLLAVLAAGAGWACRKYPEKTKEYSKKTCEMAKKAWAFASGKIGGAKTAKQPAAPRESLEAVAADCGFTVSGSHGSLVAKGDFKTRVGRLEATARAYAASPGIKVDFTDVESLANAVSELLTLVSEGDIVLDRVEGRKAFLSGRAASRGALEKVLRSLSGDVPKIASVDCSHVVIGGAVPVVAKDDAAGGSASPAAEYNVPKMKSFRQAASVKPAASRPGMPVVGILTIPYPCLVLSDGTRAMEGARFGEFTIEKIESDRVTVRGAEGSFEWRP